MQINEIISYFCHSFMISKGKNVPRFLTKMYWSKIRFVELITNEVTEVKFKFVFELSSVKNAFRIFISYSVIEEMNFKLYTSIHLSTWILKKKIWKNLVVREFLSVNQQFWLARFRCKHVLLSKHIRQLLKSKLIEMWKWNFQYQGIELDYSRDPNFTKL